MSSKSVQTTVGNPRESDNANSTVSEDVETTKESTNPSVHAQEEETSLASSNKVETLEEGKRRRTLSQKAIQNAIQTKNSELSTEKKVLKSAADTVYSALQKKVSQKEIQTVSQSLEQSLVRYKKISEEISALHKQDKWSEPSKQARETPEESKIIMRYAQAAIDEADNYELSLMQESLSSSSRRTRCTMSSHRSTSSTSSARRKALAEAAAARRQVQFDRLMAEKENERKKFEAEEELRRKLMQAQFERDITILSAEKAAAVADARLEAIEQSIFEEDKLSVSRQQVEAQETRSRTETWIDAVNQHQQSPETYENGQNPPPLDNQPPVHRGGPLFPPGNQPSTSKENRVVPPVNQPPTIKQSSLVQPGNQPSTSKESPLIPPARRMAPTGEREYCSKEPYPKPFMPKGFAGNEPIFRPSTPHPSEIPNSNQCIQRVTETNERLVASLARQSLPKCHPDIFGGDATLFHPWKNSFRAMTQDTNLSPAQEMAYLRNYTKGKVQDLVDNYRKRQEDDPVRILQELWTELERRFGNTAIITNSLLQKLQEAAKFNSRDHAKLQVFADVCTDVDNQMTYLKGLACLNYPTAIRPILDNLPNYLRFKWEKKVVKYAEANNDAYPNFNMFATMIRLQSRLQNHPNVRANAPAGSGDSARRNERRPISDNSTKPDMERRRILKTATEQVEKEDPEPTKGKYCPFHERKGHEIDECKAFSKKTLEERTTWIKTAGLCFRCLTAKHRASQCKANVRCDKCKSTRHPTILHKDKTAKDDKDMATKDDNVDGEEVQSRCTSVCEGKSGGVSCSKIVLVDIFLESKPESVHRVYAIMDDQSNTSMVSPNLADRLKVDGPRENYLLSTCSNHKEVKSGRRVSGLIVRSLDGNVAKLPTLIECDHIPQDKSEIPTPAMTEHFPHLQTITKEIPPIDEDAKIEILVGRDSPELLKVRAFKNGPKGAPWAQKLSLGWTISGQVCLDRVGGPVHVLTRRTAVEISRDEQARKPDLIEGHHVEELETTPCPNYFKLSQKYTDDSVKKNVMNDIFYSTPKDNETTMSWEDRRFLEIMNNGIHKNDSGNWEMPLPFRSPKVVMPNNRKQALNRLLGLLRTFKKKPQMERDYFEFFGKVLERGHAVLVPPEELEENQRDPKTTGQTWYLPHFGVYHPKKPKQIRVVFDSSCEFKGVSLNKELLAGPDMMNSLLGVLMRFRQENVGAVCDIEQMFHSFHVDPKHRDFLRFLWFRNNDPSQEIVEYRMVVHLFGNGPSPAVATFGLRKTADEGEEEHGTKVKTFIHQDFYVDDGLTSQPTDKDAIELIKGAQATLSSASLRLHKVASNSVAVMEAFPTEDRVKDVRDMDLRHDTLPPQRSLGVQWDLQKDTFTFSVSLEEKPFTRRGVLSVVNSVYDPLGLAAPVVLIGKLLLQHLVIVGKEKQNDMPLGWDDPLPENLKRRWQCWRDELPELENVSVQRCYHPKSFNRVIRSEVHAFSDASKDATGAAVYLRQVDGTGAVSVTLAYGQAKVAPTRPITIPRLELCAAVLSTQAVKRLKKELSIEIHEVIFYTDSKVVLGYVKNETRRFHVYVANRVQLIRDASEPHQWRYVDTTENPADLATRGVTATALMQSNWLNGPPFLKQTSLNPPSSDDHGTAIDENDPEVRKQISVYSTSSDRAHDLGSDRFKRFSNWPALRRAIASLIKRAKECKTKPQPQAANRDLTLTLLNQSTSIIVTAVQREVFADEIAALEREDNNTPESRSSLNQRRRILQKSTLYRLDPFVDEDGILRVGGRLQRSDLTFEERHPVLLPKNHHLSKLLIRYYHEKVHHQGRQITHGALRSAGYWVVGGHKMVASIVTSCVNCKKLRGQTLTQKMAELPADRLEVSPPFTGVGLDVFGPWTIQTRKLRGGAAESKRWGLIFTCLSSRAIHIEVLQSMDTDAFICALRRFFAIRGPAAILRCDCGTNFVGAKSELANALSEMDEKKIKRYVTEQGCEWKFNPPHSSHFGGVWERQIGTIRRVLNAMLLSLGSSQLDHELLVTLMAEVTAIVNSRPLTAITSDTDEPKPLSPSMLLTMKQRPLYPPPGKFVAQDLYARRRWRRSQYLADQFWIRWKREYLQSLQVRPKWSENQRNLAVGDVVIVKDKEVFRNEWPLGRVIEAIESDDKKVRKAKVTVSKDGKVKTIFRPINELILLIPTTKKPES